MRTIQLTQGYSTIVDDNDHEQLSAFSWYADVNKKTGIVYAARSVNFRRSDGEYRCRRIKMHNQIMGCRDGFTVDHISRDPLDNRRTNLRWATRAQNGMNRKFKKPKSGFRGVYTSPATSIRPWIAAIQANGRARHIGSFNDPKEAAEAYDGVARELHGEFAVLNFPETQTN